MLLLLLLSLVYDGIKVHGRFSLQRCHCKQEAIILSHHHTHTHTHTRRQIHTPWFRPQQTDHPLKCCGDLCASSGCD